MASKLLTKVSNKISATGYIDRTFRATLPDGVKLTFIANPYTSSRSVLEYFHKQYVLGNVLSLELCENDSGDSCMDVVGFSKLLPDTDLGTVFSIVRNPYTRVRQVYEKRLADLKNSPRTRVIWTKQKKVSFNTFVENRKWYFLDSQSTFISGTVLKYEDLEQEFLENIIIPYFNVGDVDFIVRDRLNFDGALNDISFLNYMSENSLSQIEAIDNDIFENYGYEKYVR